MGKGASSRRAHHFNDRTALWGMVGTPSARAFARSAGFAHPTFLHPSFSSFHGLTASAFAADVVDRHVAFGALDRTAIGPVDSDFVRERLLAQAARPDNIGLRWWSILKKLRGVVIS
jgi:hypothetical protein